jgi:hypothetical protein
MKVDKLSQELDEFNQQRVYEELINAWTGSADWINEFDKDLDTNRKLNSYYYI